MSVGAFWSDFVKAQADMPAIGKNRTANIETRGGGSYSYKFADLSDVVAAVTPVLHKHGLGFAQSTVTHGDQVGVITRIVHKSGYEQTFGLLTLPMGGDARTAGSAITYARRYSLLAALGLVADEDDDGAATEVRNRQETPVASANTPIVEGYVCPSCGTAVQNNLQDHFADNKKPAFRCGNKACQGGGAKKQGGGFWPWATWDADFFRKTTDEFKDDLGDPILEQFPLAEYEPGEEPF